MNSVFFQDILNKWKFHKEADRLGPDMLFSHWKLHFPSQMKKMCKAKFKCFSSTSDFRPGAYAVSCSNITLGSNVVIRPTTMLFADEFAGIDIESNVMIGSGVHFYVNNHKFDNCEIPIIEQGYYPSENIKVKEGAWIGANSVILPGVTVGYNSVIGAGSIVTRSVPDHCVVAGVPARIIRNLSDNK